MKSNTVTNARAKSFRLLPGVLIVTIAWAGCIEKLHAELSDNCVVSVLNRTVQVKPDGTWVLPNIPANFGPVRGRATCVENGVTTSGESALFTIPVNGSCRCACYQSWPGDTHSDFRHLIHSSRSDSTTFSYR